MRRCAATGQDESNQPDAAASETKFPLHLRLRFQPALSRSGFGPMASRGFSSTKAATRLGSVERRHKPGRLRLASVSPFTSASLSMDMRHIEYWRSCPLGERCSARIFRLRLAAHYPAWLRGCGIGRDVLIRNSANACTCFAKPVSLDRGEHSVSALGRHDVCKSTSAFGSSAYMTPELFGRSCAPL
jgi:hypothetical protein